MMNRKDHDYFSQLCAEAGKIDPAMSCPTNSPEAYRRWRGRFRRKLVELLGGLPGRKNPLAAELRDEKYKGPNRRLKYAFMSEPGSAICAYLLIPKKVKSPSPAIICQHGHGLGKDDVMGIAHSPAARHNIRKFNYAYAHKLALRGYVVLAPDAAGFGERESRLWEIPGHLRDTCFMNSLSAMLVGKTYIGKRVWDTMRCVDFLAERPLVDHRRIGIVGLSGGGTVSLFSAALEKRIKLAVVSGYFCTFRDSLFTKSGCACNFIPGIMKYCDMPDIAALIAPRPLFIQSGRKDELFPINGAKAAFGKLSRVYRLLGSGGMVHHHVHPLGHTFVDREAFDWIDSHI